MVSENKFFILSYLIFLKNIIFKQISKEMARVHFLSIIFLKFHFNFITKFICFINKILLSMARASLLNWKYFPWNWFFIIYLFLFFVHRNLWRCAIFLRYHHLSINNSSNQYGFDARWFNFKKHMRKIFCRIFIDVKKNFFVVFHEWNF